MSNDSVRETILTILNYTSSPNLTDDEVQLLDSLPPKQTINILDEMFRNTDNRTVRSRSFNALLEQENFDRVQFLITLFDNAPSVGWKSASCRNLSRFRDERAIMKLCDILLHDSDGTLRYVAAESLQVVGDVTAIETLFHASQNDRGEDYEGFSIAAMADKALQTIRGRSEVA